ncbi:YesL family protein [Caldibacillus thermoamylovorans]|uniref:YesL family protein n=1 Tax=Caldibacillus thermoamylovorans TaxID=35841 RepID=UPI00203F64B4|nr:DUF624 domain-containing protein [Caldibacillus thermoamylovorans]MCM3478488.1 DUF624 domain-containing protein [Caldibacillus thermoamylovorans]
MLKSAKIVNFIYMVFCLHIQWLLHVVKGFIIVGIFPSTAAVYAVIRDLLLKKEIDSLSYTFSNYYSHNFKVANILGWLFFAFSGAVILNFMYIPYYPESIRIFMYGMIVFLAVILMVAWFYLFPSVVHFDFPVHIYIIGSLKTGFSSLFGLLLHIMTICIFVITLLKFPAIYFFFGITPLAFAQMSISLYGFNKVL